MKLYIQQKLQDLEKGKDLKELTSQGKLSFGVSSKDFGHLPSWKELVKKKKKLLQLIWTGSFVLSFCIVGTTFSFDEDLGENWIRTIISWIAVSVCIMLFHVIWFYYSIFFHFRQTEREVRKLIYEDILHQLKKEETHLV